MSDREEAKEGRERSEDRHHEELGDAIKLLARFYEAHDRQTWHPGESLEDVWYDVAVFLEGMENDGWEVAKVERRPAEPPPPTPVTARPRRRK